MEIICLESEALYDLIEKVVDRLSEDQKLPPPRWIDKDEAMDMLKIKSTSLQKLRDEGKIRFTKVLAKNILYDRFSIEEYLEEQAHERF